MPNHVKNILKMKGITKLPLFSHKDGEMFFDFNKIIPMPETLQMESGSIENLAVEVVLRKLASPQSAPLRSCITPNMRDDVYQRCIENNAMSEDELCKLGLAYITNKVLYGATSWYYWCIMNWGSKWNSYSYEEQDEDTISFETAWNAPEPVVSQLAAMYPDAVIEHWWADENCGANSGYARYEGNGETITNYHETGSSAALANYARCWGESWCYQDGEELWCQIDCDECHGC